MPPKGAASTQSPVFLPVPQKPIPDGTLSCPSGCPMLGDLLWPQRTVPYPSPCPAHSTRHESCPNPGKTCTSLSQRLSQDMVAHGDLLSPVLTLPGASPSLTSPFPTMSAQTGGPQKTPLTSFPPSKFLEVYGGFNSLWAPGGFGHPKNGGNVFARVLSHSVSLQLSPSQKGGDGDTHTHTHVLGAHLHRRLLALIAAGGAQPRGLLQQELACHLESLQKRHSAVGRRKAALLILLVLLVLRRARFPRPAPGRAAGRTGSPRV